MGKRRDAWLLSSLFPSAFKRANPVCTDDAELCRPIKRQFINKKWAPPSTEADIEKTVSKYDFKLIQLSFRHNYITEVGKTIMSLNDLVALNRNLYVQRRCKF